MRGAAGNARRSLLSRGMDLLLGATLMYAMLLASGLRVPGLRKTVDSGIVTLKGRATAVDDNQEGNNAHDGVQLGAHVMDDVQSAHADRTPADKLSVMRRPERTVAPTSTANSHSWKYKLPGKVCPVQHSDQVGIDDIAFGILTSERFLVTRLASQRRTWIQHVRHVVFYSESVVASLPTIPLTPPRGEQLVGGGAWKNFPALIDLAKRFPRQQWIFFNDDDTYIFIPNLLRSLLKYDHGQDFYLGLYWTPRIDMEWKEVKLAYASGGAGYVISRGLMAKLAPTLPGCHGNYTRWAGDVRVGKCIMDLNVRVTPAVGYHHEGHDK